MERIRKLPSKLKKLLLAAHGFRLHGSLSKSKKHSKLDKEMERLVSTFAGKYICSYMSKEELKQVVVFVDDATHKYTSKSAFIKYFVADIANCGIKNFLEEQKEEEGTLAIIARILYINENCDDLKKRIAEELEIHGIKEFLQPASTTVLTDCCDHMGFTVKKGHTKVQLIDAIATGSIGKAAHKTKPVIKISKHKPEISKGISKVDLFHYYGLEKLAKFCKTHKIKSSGSKKVLMERILAYLEGDDTVLVGHKKPKKPKKKATKKKGKKGGKTKKDKESESESGSEGEGKETGTEEEGEGKAKPAAEGDPKVSKKPEEEEEEGKPKAEEEEREEPEPDKTDKKLERTKSKKAAESSSESESEKDTKKKHKDKKGKKKHASSESSSEEEDTKAKISRKKSTTTSTTSTSSTEEAGRKRPPTSPAEKTSEENPKEPEPKKGRKG
ncbi:hypothetical protein Pelo_523 [Pelomyxa schiedti]|nr:hypothetical protein Pelo_523 [Pelomyxa schiedti]